jgi:hypothetical protein
MRIICIVDAAWGIRYLLAMRHGVWRSLSALVSGTAFAVAVAGPVQWDPCPTHGAGPHVQGAAMQMPTGAEMPAAATHDGDSSGSHHAGHQCTCPGGCCGSTAVGLRTSGMVAPLAMLVEVPSRVAQPADAVDLASSHQVVLPFAHAPPAFRLTPQHAAHVET